MPVAMIKHIVLFVCIILTSCDADRVQEKKDFNPFDFERKYYLDECLVEADLSKLFQGEANRQVWDVLLLQTKIMIEERKLPLFSYYTEDVYNFTFYFSDKCEDRVRMVELFLNKYVIPQVKGKVDYYIKAKIMSIEELGSVPSGWWLKR